MVVSWDDLIFGFPRLIIYMYIHIYIYINWPISGHTLRTPVLSDGLEGVLSGHLEQFHLQNF